MTEYKFSLERSSYSYSRQKLLVSNNVPKLSEAVANLGSQLAEVIFNQCEEALKDDFGLSKPLKGPGDFLWISPSDLLIGKVALKPPFSPKCLQALTHQGISAIGENLDKRFRQEMELDKQKTFEKYKSELLATIEDRLKIEIKNAEIRERLTCHNELEKQKLEYENILREESKKLEQQMLEEHNRIVNANHSLLKEFYEKKMDEEIEKTVHQLTKSFLRQLDEQEDKITKAFELELRKRDILRDFDAKLYKSKINEALRQLKHNLECTNLVNMMYILCSERSKCCENKALIEKSYQKKLGELQEISNKNNTEIKNLKSELQLQIKQVQIRETFVREIIKQFQKFINFALKAAPTQAEFLLSVEKMLTFELVVSIKESEVVKAQEENFIIPWGYNEVKRKSAVKSNIEIKDGHNCFNELSTPTFSENGSEIGEEVTLPAVYFKNKMYVREDFRDMLSAGLEISPSNEIWNKDVEFLINYWREQLNENELEDNLKGVSSIEVSINQAIDVQDTVSTTNERRKSKQSTVQFIDNGALEGRRRSGESKKLGRKSSLRPASFPLMESEHPEPVSKMVSSSKILAAKDSLEVIMDQKNRSISVLVNQNKDYQEANLNKESSEIELSKPSTDSRESKKLAVGARDSVILRMRSLIKDPSSAEFNTSPKDSIEIAKYPLDKSSDVKNKSSKFTSARNSIELLRESLSKLREPAQMCQKKDLHQDQSTQIFGFAGTCCERCKRKEGILNISSGTEVTKDGSKILRPDSFLDEKSVKISRIQIINLDGSLRAPSVVSFHEKTKVLEAKNNTDNLKRKSSYISRSKKPNISNKLKIIGDRQAREGKQSNDQFTADRIHSLLNVLKKNPEVLRLFTTGGR